MFRKRGKKEKKERKKWIQIAPGVRHDRQMLDNYHQKRTPGSFLNLQLPPVVTAICA